MFDALQDTPRDFQFKLMDALNSLGQTMEIPPTECFDKVLCASDDENPDVKKTMYNWWRAFFEVLGKTSGNLPKDRDAEFTEKVDALMAEIMKSGDKESSEGNEVVLEDFEQVKEDYEEADKAEEDEMNKDFDFAVKHIGEIANKVKDIVNFVNPYCESVGGTSKMNEDEVREFVKSIGFRPDLDGIDYETQLVDALTGKDTSSNAGWGAVYYNSDKVLQFLKKYGMLGSRGIKQREAISKLRRLFKSGKWKETKQQEFDLGNEVETTMKKLNERGGSDWVSMDDMIGMEVGESDNGEGFWKAADEVDDLEKKGYWSAKFKVGDKVTWIDPDGDEIKEGWTVTSAPESEDEDDDMYTIETDDGSEAEVYGSELRPALETVVNEENSKMENELKKGDDGWREIGQPIEEATVTVDANDVWAVLDLLDDETANKNLTDLINSHVRTEDEIMDAIDSCYPEGVRKGELNAYMKDSFYEIVDELGLDVEKFKQDGQFVDPKKPVALEGSEDEQKPDEVKDGEKKYKQDGETKTLVTGSDKENNTNNKQEVTEMTIEQEITDPWKLLEMLWGQGRDNLRELLESEMFDDEFVMQMIEDMEIHDLTAINDAFAYDFETILDMFGCDPHAWSQNLEIKRKGDEDSEED